MPFRTLEIRRLFLTCDKCGLNEAIERISPSSCWDAIKYNWWVVMGNPPTVLCCDCKPEDAKEHSKWINEQQKSMENLNGKSA
jgi:hypothetical protein